MSDDDAHFYTQKKNMLLHGFEVICLVQVIGCIFAYIEYQAAPHYVNRFVLNIAMIWL